ncbi:hypothetical protein [Caenimonas aquaedulcis]|uniref:Serine/threonine protein kinase n=1 Tax=Caenimonas aquaedulcis TaxID=2793270 RepID=A0A931H5T9_9BURK|nr:hypothetical protein [Caenimonas aquaedulcis]MBG9389083.1 serine/threonine protein kinase [Caenimonas aquaedulcis]
MSVTCILFGLGIRFNAALSGLEGLPRTDRVDVDFTLGALPPHSGTLAQARGRTPYVSTLETDEGHVELFATRLPGSKDFRLDYDDGTVVVIESDGRRVWADWPATRTADDVATYLLGPVMGLVLRLRGVLCLHASAVAIDGRSIAFVGVSGAGKSTLVAAMGRAGYPVLSDDLVPIRDGGLQFEVIASRPRLRLWPRSADAIYGPAHALPRIAPASEKRMVDLTAQGNGVPSDLPLGGAYFLGRRESALASARFGDLDARSAVMAMIADAFASRYLDRELRAREFDLACRLARQMTLRRLTAPDDLSSLPRLCDAIAADVRTVRHARAA